MAIRRKLGVRAGRNGSPPRCRLAVIRLTSFISTMDDLRLRLADMGEHILDATYADLLLNNFPKEFAFIRQMHHRDRSFMLEQIKQTAINFHIDELSKTSSAPTVAGRVAAMAAASRSGSVPPVQSFWSLPA